jgi:hypothetical protein
MGGLCWYFQVGPVEAVEPMLSETEALQLCGDGYALLYANPNGIELWTPVGISVRWDVNLAAVREPAADTVSITPTPLTVSYTNYKGVTRLRRVIPKRVFFGSNQWHPDPQWLLDVFDVDTEQRRTFALKDMEGTDLIGTLEKASDLIVAHTRDESGLSDFDRALRALKTAAKRDCTCDNRKRRPHDALDPKLCGPCIAAFALARMRPYPALEAAHVEDGQSRSS